MGAETSRVKSADGDQQESYLRIDNLWKAFGDFIALKNISLTISDGEFVCFLGPSGCGKTTLLRAIAGLDLQTSGGIEQAGKDISNLPPAERDFGIVFQSYALFPNLTIEKNISFGLENAGLSKSVISARVKELLELVGLPEQGKKYPAQLSGGQQQRIALARAIAMSPGLLLLDEPLSALDAKVRVHLRHEVKELQRKLGITTVMVTHDQEEALSMADRIVVMNHGVIEQIGTPTEIYREPATLFVADFIGEMNQIAATAAEKTADGRSAVKIGSKVFTCGDHDFPAGTDVIAAVRPEDIVPHGAYFHDKIAETENAIACRIKEMEFLGSFWRTRLSSDTLGDAEIFADFSINAIRRLDIAEDMDIAVEIPGNRLKIFAAKQDVH
ncbi:putative 2-aminoethylphosphonate ABC transporter ATP-binding protein [uncultured Sneathiella sp.]|jgi:iron(III) transport system ATP-binding protein|uniref:putative 2-aminoethylphosphonate ABC transporter ATP-binding protein n=1 Tax=uncultured Sneathiella sp. TaxID=879315 RepID=UPI0030D9ED88|tara:strand:- start:22628 stop:23785 length:1158 start_codon:yes stop_codon:yes gene_type:complete